MLNRQIMACYFYGLWTYFHGLLKSQVIKIKIMAARMRATNNYQDKQLECLNEHSNLFRRTREERISLL
jgi:cytosine/uracil/thiamine/allantoin permease